MLYSIHWFLMCLSDLTKMFCICVFYRWTGSSTEKDLHKMGKQASDEGITIYREIAVNSTTIHMQLF